MNRKPSTEGKIKVVHLSSSLCVGGAEMMLYKLVTSEVNYQIEHVVISLLDVGPVGKMIEEAGVPVYALNMARGKMSARALLELVRMLRQLRPDLVQSWMYHANLMALVGNKLAARVPIIWGLRHSNFDPARNKASTLRIVRLNARLSRFTDAIVCCSEKTRDNHRAIGYAQEKLHMIPNGFDTSVFRPDDAARSAVRSELGIPGDATLIGMVGRFDPLKDHPNFLRAARAVRAVRPQVQFLLCGPGISWDIEQLAGQLRALRIDDAFHLLGPRDDVWRVMNALDLHVLSSAGEGFPNVLGEAMACGVPCIGTDVGDAALIVGESGWVVPPKDPDALSASILDFLDLREDELSRRREMARSRIVENFSIEAVREQYRHLYRRLLARGEA